MQIDPSFREQAKRARQRQRLRMFRRGIWLLPLVGLGVAVGVWLWHRAAPEGEIMVQVDDGIAIAPPVLRDAFLDIPGDPMIIQMPEQRSPEEQIPPPPGLDRQRLGASAPFLGLSRQGLHIRDRRLSVALPTTREDLALFRAQRNRVMRTEGAGAQLSENRGLREKSHVYLRDSALRHQSWSEVILEVQLPSQLADLLRDNGFPEAEAEAAMKAADFLPDSGLAPGNILALRYSGAAPMRKLLQLSLYDPAFSGALARVSHPDAASDQAQFVPASDPWFDDDLTRLADEDTAPGQTRLLDQLYSAALRSGAPLELVGELVTMLAQTHDLDAAIAEGDELLILHAGEVSAIEGPEQILYIGVDGPSGHKPCYVVADTTSGGWRCFAPGARQAAPDTDLRMLMPVDGRIALRFSSATPWISWDISGKTDVTAPAAGRIEAIDSDTSGITVTIRHDDVISRLLHLDQIAEGLAVGATVRPGQALGVAGGHGKPGLQVLRDGQPVDPMPYLGGTGGIRASDAVEGLINRIITIESAGDARARNPRSSATGLGQFIDSTWLRMMGSYRPDLMASLDRETLLALRFDPELSRQMVRHLAQENEAYLRARGFEATPGRLYLAHFLGPEGANQILRADPALPVGTVTGAAVIQANPFLANYSVADLRRWADQRMGQAGAEPLPEAAPIPPEIAQYMGVIDTLLARG